MNFSYQEGLNMLSRSGGWPECGHAISQDKEILALTCA